MKYFEMRPDGAVRTPQRNCRKPFPFAFMQKQNKDHKYSEMKEKIEKNWKWI